MRLVKALISLETRKAQEEPSGELGLDPADATQDPPCRRTIASGDEVGDRPAIAWRESEQMSVEPISCSGRIDQEVFAGFQEQAQLSRPVRQSDRRQVLLPGRHPSDGKGIARIALARPACAQAFDAAQVRWHLSNGKSGTLGRPCQRGPERRRALNADHHLGRDSTGPGDERDVAGRIVGKRRLADRPAKLVDGAGR